MIQLLRGLRRRVAPVWRRLPPVSRLLEERNVVNRDLAALQVQLAALREAAGSPHMDPEGAPLLVKQQELNERVAELERGQLFPPGHFYSPIPDPAWLAENAARLASANPTTLAGIELRAQSQLDLLTQLGPLAAEIPFGEEPTATWRYGFANDQYSYGDASCLFAMLRHLRPKRYVEVGSGWSSALALDVNAAYFDYSMSLTFIEPYPERLEARLRPEDRDVVTLHRCPVQEVDLNVFTSLEAGDICFIDSTHVAKAGSDVNFLVFEVLPRLAAGVHVHVHDIGWPFEYFEDWLKQGRNWNETYLLRAYLADNRCYEIQLWNSYLMRNHGAALCAALPLSARNTGASLWLRRV